LPCLTRPRPAQVLTAENMTSSTSSKLIGTPSTWEMTPTGSCLPLLRRNERPGVVQLSQITIKGRNLSILLENVVEHGLQYHSRMLWSWNKFCFTSGYIKVSMMLRAKWRDGRICESLLVLCSCVFRVFMFVWPDVEDGAQHSSIW
jgi:hypothetical protein